jgi:hypothetical protein
MMWVSVAIGADPEVEEKELVFKFETYLLLKPCSIFQSVWTIVLFRLNDNMNTLKNLKWIF